MVDYVIMPKQDYEDVCNAVRSKTGKTDLLTSGDLCDEIENMETGGGGASFNIHYGLNPPEDTSMLWVETEKEPSKTTITNGFTFENNVEQAEQTLPSATNAFFTLPVVDGFAYALNMGDGTDIWKYDPKTLLFEVIAQKTEYGHVSASFCAVGTKIFSFGGYNGSTYAHVTDIFVFDTENETLQKLDAVLPAAGSYHAIAAVGAKIYLFGGNPFSSKIYEFDTTDYSIRELTSTLLGNQQFQGCIAHGVNIYLFGGRDPNSTIDKIYKFDTVTEQITTLGSVLPSSRDRMGCGKFGNTVYLFGGLNNTQAPLTSIYEFDLVSEQIRESTLKLPSKKGSMMSVLFGNEIHLLGGRTSSSTSSKSNTIFRFKSSGELMENELVIIPSFDALPIELLSGDNTLIIGVSNVFAGNENDQAETANARLFNETSQTWELI